MSPGSVPVLFSAEGKIPKAFKPHGSLLESKAHENSTHTIQSKRKCSFARAGRYRHHRRYVGRLFDPREKSKPGGSPFSNLELDDPNHRSRDGGSPDAHEW